jgi:UDP-2,3-diacylglucosamine hydrolase
MPSIMPFDSRPHLFVSDLHLESVDSLKFRRFQELLDAWKSEAAGIWLLGDITELWIGDDDDGPLADALTVTLRDTTRRCPVHLMQGNRDFLYGEVLVERTGVELIPDPFPMGGSVLLAHGDAWCIDDLPYQQFRRLVRSPEWQREILDKSIDERRAFGAALRAKSRETNANKAANIMDVNAGAMRSALAHHACHSVVHGHTHRPGLYDLDQGNLDYSNLDSGNLNSGKRLVLGAWDGGVGWYGLLRTGRFSLHVFSLEYRYETGSRDRHPG